ncbi:hypothetical protein [Methanococcoides alaskense]|nr:hypothetical protein [Methanococcoides alaskense]MDA0525799.1 hypothetical protein [Methanococcoides alaskense]
MDDVNLNLESEDPSADSSKKRTRNVTKLEYPLPNGKIDQNHRKIMITHFMLTRNGNGIVTYKDFSPTSLGFSNTSISSDLKFFESIGLIKSPKNSYYELTEVGYNFADKLMYDRTDEAKQILKKILVDSWFYKKAETYLAINDSASFKDMVHEFAHAAKAEIPKHQRNLKILVDYLVFANLLTSTDDDMVTLSNGFDISEKTDVPEKSTEKLYDNDSLTSAIKSIRKETSIETVDQEPLIATLKVNNPSASTNINVDISISLEITPDMTPDDIKGKLDAIISSLKDQE